jgi:cobaltochelatase CobT
MTVDKKPFWQHFFSGGESGTDTSSDYKVYTTKYDIQTDADDLDHVLGPLVGKEKDAFDAAYGAFEQGLAGWRTTFDIACLESAHGLAHALTLEQRHDMVVSLLIDHSGSMKGQRLLMVAAMIASLVQSLIGLRIKVEVLGFTTVSWKGGHARKDWLRWRNPRPGRLCELLHIVYREASSVNPGMPWSLRNMLRPDLPKENIDGEAIEWAARRLRGRPETRKVLLVLTDGAAVDDSTILANGVEYLYDHLKRVVAGIEAEGTIAIGAIDICSNYAKKTYSCVAEVDDLMSLGTVTLAMVARLVAPQPRLVSQP